MKKVSVLGVLVVLTHMAFAQSPGSTQNSVVETRVRVSGLKTVGELNGLPVESVNRTIQYLDGLGRPLQTVQWMGSPMKKDLVQPVEYDALGRELKKYLPYAAQSSSDGSYKSTAFTDQAAFYGSSGWEANVVKTLQPFSLSILENSPLNRVQQQGAPGGVWQPYSTSVSGSGHTQKMGYGTNAALEVSRWVMSGSGASVSGSYAANTLQKTTSKDENWVESDLRAGTSEEFKDFEGRVVLKRVWKTGTENYSTYYLYDAAGNLRYVLPPALHTYGQDPISSFTDYDIHFNNFIYAYRYDGRRRVQDKKIPGKGWEHLVYNQLDQVVLSQDALQESNHEWLFSKYDALGRVVQTGIYTDVTALATLRTTVYTSPVKWEHKITTGLGYSNEAFPTSNTEVLTVNYYGDYTFPGNTLGNPSGSAEMNGGRIIGLQTGSLVKVLGSSDLLLTVNFYDEEGRVVRSKSQHYLSGSVNASNYDEVSNTFSFVGELLTSTRVHYTTGGNTTILNEYTYDHQGRKLNSSEQINGQPKVTLSSMAYNEIGQLKSKGLHSVAGSPFIQTVGYSYNERGWIKNSGSSLFAYQLNYQDAVGSGILPQYNGNISNQLWGSGLSNVFSYRYDKLNRLTSGMSTGTFAMSEELTYDAMGNISSLNRDGAGANAYTYTGNQLGGVANLTAAYVYDANGNASTDGRNGMGLTYNYLNLPKTATKDGVALSYGYDAVGRKLSKNYNGLVRNYIDGIEYNGSTIDVIHTEEGLAQNNGGTYTYQYNLTDHLGNVRYSFDVFNGAARRLQENNYYAFGKNKPVSPISGNNKYLYNGKEVQEELGEQLDYGARLYDPVVARFNTIDPLSEVSRRNSPYGYALNNPIRFIDVDGMYAASPIFDQDGNFLGTDDQGMKGSDIIMKREDFKQGMSHKEAVKKDLGVGSLDLEATRNWYSFSKTIESRPDYDGFVSIKEGVEWAKSHPGALKNPTPENTLYIDASKLDFGNITASDLKNGVGKSSPINLNNAGNFLASRNNATLRSTVYALGRVDLTLLNNNGSIKVVNNSATDYDWNPGGSTVRSTLIGFERWRADLNDSHGFKTFYYGTGQLRK